MVARSASSGSGGRSGVDLTSGRGLAAGARPPRVPRGRRIASARLLRLRTLLTSSRTLGGAGGSSRAAEGLALQAQALKRFQPPKGLHQVADLSS
jgi:hypothetical protein